MNYAEGIFEKLTSVNAIVTPPPELLRLWENKVFMHTEFERLNIPTPKTLIKSLSQMNGKEEFPILLKYPHSSGSKGLYKLDNQQSLNALLKIFDVHKAMIVQEFIPLTMDVRVVVENGIIKSHYWRKNVDSKEWHPTSTSLGSILSYDPLPDEVVTIVNDTIKKMSLSFCAFDLAFRDERGCTNVVVLEVSPFYQLNPVNYRDIPYRDFKRKLLGPKTYWRQFCDITMSSTESLIEYYDEN